MYRITLFSVAAVFVAGFVLGCGGQKPSVTPGGGGEPAVPTPGDSPKPIPKDDLPAKKTKLAELRAQIAAKEKDLAALKSEADALDRLIRQSETSGLKVYTKPEDLFADMPKESYPSTGADKGLERNAAKKWCEANLVGRVVEWTDEVEKPSLSSEEPYLLTFGSKAFGAHGDTSQHLMGRMFGGEFKLGGEPVGVFLASNVMLSDKAGAQLFYRYHRLTADEAKTMRALEGKVTFRATITGAANLGTSGLGPKKDDNGFAKWTKLNAITLEISSPSINGHLPASYQTKPKK